MADDVIYVDPVLANNRMLLRVGGTVYRLVGPSDRAPNSFDVDFDVDAWEGDDYAGESDAAKHVTTVDLSPLNDSLADMGCPLITEAVSLVRMPSVDPKYVAWANTDPSGNYFVRISYYSENADSGYFMLTVFAEPRNPKYGEAISADTPFWTGTLALPRTQKPSGMFRVDRSTNCACQAADTISVS
jgi:hypothetical protein